MCTYRKAFVFKPISNQLNILVGRIILRRLYTINDFATAFSSLTLYKFVALKENTLSDCFQNCYSNQTKHTPQGVLYVGIRICN